ncbi:MULTISPECIES: hypothetical protein [Clostridium]|uniref:hypothetical protein n=1 Tax=Clostridium TaxID=1485 RepID=UPI0008259C7C|nr:MULTISPECIES: hypothetical protein [Clostridium]PJI09574.1 hypothetical protein CUB90_17630 [Clostridium sp. CT7]
MAYNIVDILDKAINVANKVKIEYETIGKEKCDIQSIKIMSKVLVKQLDKTIEYYESLKEQIGDTEFEEIDFFIYDKMASLINQFNKKTYIKDINNVRDYLMFSLGLEKDVYSLLIDVQGRFVEDTSDMNTETYKILSNIINNEAEHIAILEKTLHL